MLTLSVEEVANWNRVAILGMDSGVPEHLIDVGSRADTHILLAKVPHVGIDVGILELLGKRDLLKLHLVNTSCGGAEQRSGCCEYCALHLAGLGGYTSWSGMNECVQRVLSSARMVKM